MTPLIRSLATASILALPAAASAQDAPVLAVITHPVEDYATWRQIYDDFADVQQAAGVVSEQVYRDPADPNSVLVLHGFDTLEAAASFLTSDELRSAMQGAGVSRPPEITIMSRAD